MKNKLTLAFDIDSTIWDAEPLYSEAAEELFGHGFSAEDVTHFYWLRDEYGPDFWEIFNKALHPDWMHKREMYPGVEDVIEDLKDMGIRIHFITHNVNPDLMRKPLKKWLQDHFGDVGLSITSSGKKIPIMKRINAYGIVEDKYQTMRDALNEGYKVYGKLQAHNRRHIENNPYIATFDNWSEAKDIITSDALDMIIQLGREARLQRV